MIKLSEHLKNILEIMNNSKIEVLKTFSDSVAYFDYTKKYRSGNVSKYLNEDGKRINRKNKPVDCVSILSIIFDQQISFLCCDKDDNFKTFTEKSLLIVDRDGVKCGNLTDYNNQKSYNFEIKNNRVTKFNEIKQVSREK